MAGQRDDLGQSLKLSSIWEIPKTRIKGPAGGVANGWALTSNLFWRGGFPFNVRSGKDNSLTGLGRDRPDFRGTDIHQAATLTSTLAVRNRSAMPSSGT